MQEPEIQIPQQEKTSFIFRVEEMLDDVGRRVIRRVVVSGTATKDFIEYVGLSQVILQIGHGPNAQQQPSQYRFPIEGATSLEDAYARFDVENAKYARLHAEEVKQRLAELHKQATNPPLVVPDAKTTRRFIPPS